MWWNRRPIMDAQLTNLQKLCNAIISIWSNISEERFQHLFESMTLRTKVLMAFHHFEASTKNQLHRPLIWFELFRIENIVQSRYKNLMCYQFFFLKHLRKWDSSTQSYTRIKICEAAAAISQEILLLLDDRSTLSVFHFKKQLIVDQIYCIEFAVKA